MLSQSIDWADKINGSAQGYCVLDLSGWDYIVAHIIGNAAAVSFWASNDAGAVQGTTDGNAATATNFLAVQGTNVQTGVAATSAAISAAPGILYKFTNVGRFMRFSTTPGQAVSKLILYYGKLN